MDLNSKGGDIMRKVIVYRSLPKNKLEFLKKYFDISYFPEVSNPLENKEFIKELKTTDALFGAGMEITEELLNEALNLKVISNFSAGYDNLNLKILSEKGIIATNSPDVLSDTVADLIFSLLLTTSRRIVELDSFIRKGCWHEKINEKLFGVDVHNKTIGMLGLGRIGKKVAQRALGFEMNILYHKRSRDMQAEKIYQARYVENLDMLLAKSDFICITLPLNENTKHMINYEKMKKMKSNAIIVNASRGSIIKELDLIKALKNNVINGAGLDVFEEEPIEITNELIDLNNVVLTPHIGSATTKTREKMIEQGIDNLIDALNGKIPNNLLN